MRYVSTSELQEQFTNLIDSAQREPVTIRRDQTDVAVLLSAEDYRKLTLDKVEEFNRFCDMIGKRVAARGLTDEKLAELLAEDD